MRIPLSWIKEYIPLEHTPEEIAKMLTMAGIEVDRLETIGASLDGVVIAKVTHVEKHPDADKLVVANVTVGADAYQVVCGAPNCRGGIKVALATVGTKLEEDGKTFTVKKSKIRGVESCGMLCSEKELNMGEDHDGIMEFSDDLPEGTLLKDLYGDTVFEISLTPNLGHCNSVIGIARELSAATGIPIRHPLITLKESAEPSANSVQVKVVDPEGCPRYTCRVVKQVKVGPSPDWLKSRLEKCGLRSINNVVDITNYVLMELGHPLHAFDLDRLEGKQIIVKKASEEEKFQTLDDKERLLTSSDLMICDAKRSVALAGVMGGLNSEVHDETKNLVIESAYFDPVTIRKTSKRLGLQTDSSKRFERGTDPNGLITSLDRAAMLIQQLAGGQVSNGVVDIKQKEFPQLQIPCRLSRINKILGITLSRGEVETIFTKLHFHFTVDGDLFTVKVPTYRVDIKAEIDLIEEVARIYGYDNIPRVGGKHHSSPLPPAPIYVFEKEVRSRLIGEGLQEFLTCDLIGPTFINIVKDQKIDPESVVTVMNPTSIEQSILRTSLLPGLLQVVKHNVDHQSHHIGGFEVGRIHFKEKEQFKEQSVAAIILSGKATPKNWDLKERDYDYFDIKGIVENLLKELGITNASYKNLGLPTFHSGRQASLFVNQLEIGTIGEIHPDIQRRLDVKQRIIYGEFDLQDLMQLAKRTDKIKPLAIYPGSERDWTVTIKNSVPYATIMTILKGEKAPLLESVSLLDIYRSDKLEPGYQNVTLRFVYRDPTKTIAQEVVDAEHQRLTTEMINKLGDAIKI